LTNSNCSLNSKISNFVFSIYSTVALSTINEHFFLVLEFDISSIKLELDHTIVGFNMLE